MNEGMTRREVLGQALAAGALVGMPAAAVASESSPRAGSATAPAGSFRISLNTSTLRGQKLPLVDLIDLAANVGYDGIEPWVDEIERHLASGGTLKDLDKRLKDRNLRVTGAIAFYEWMVDDDGKRASALEQARRHMGRLAEIGATHMAAPPCGDVKNVDLLKAAQRYHDLLEAGGGCGVIPTLEIWGWASNLTRLGQAVMVALEADHPKACILPDVYHLYKGGSGLSGISRLNPNLLGGFHLNDYPSTPPRETIADKDRVYPGDGVAPLKQLVRDLRTIGYRGPVSVELFNPNYFQQDPAQVARTALDKTRAVIRGTV
jgi:2-keto-myo-inositol isomerase